MEHLVQNAPERLGQKLVLVIGNGELDAPVIGSSNLENKLAIDFVDAPALTLWKNGLKSRATVQKGN